MNCKYSKLLAIIVLFFFSWTSGGLFQVAYAVGNLPNPGYGQGDGSIEVFQKAIDEIGEILEDPAIGRETKAAKVKGKRAEINDLDVEIRKQFAEIEKKLRDASLPKEILQRHHRFVKHYDDNLNELKANLNSIEKTKGLAVEVEIEKARQHLQRVKPPKRYAPLDPNKLPNRTPKIERKEPRLKKEDFEKDFIKPQKAEASNKPILIAASGSLKGLLSENSGYITPQSAFSNPQLIVAQATNLPTPEDLAQNIEVQFTPEIIAKAQELGNNPVKIYNWVRNNIEFVPTYGSIQGAHMTLLTKQGNAFDTASLLIALLRASNIPARYVYGTIELPIDKFMNWAGGFTNPMAALELIASGGTPVVGMVSNGSIVTVRMEQIWVEAWVDYIPSRGAMHRSGEGDTWIHLDPTFKQNTYTQPLDIRSAVPFDEQSFLNQIINSATVNESEGSVTGVDCSPITQTLNAYKTSVKNYLDQSDPSLTVGDVLGKKNIIPQDFPYLLGTLPYKALMTGAKVPEIPDSLRHKVQIKLLNDSLAAIDVIKPLPGIAGQKITLGYLPATQADRDLINSHLPAPHPDGSPIQWNELPQSLPAYLIKVKPELRVGGIAVASGQEISLGSRQTLSTTFIGPAQEEMFSRMITAGQYSAIAIDTGRVAEGLMATLKTKIENARAKLLQSNLGSLSREDVFGDIFYASALAYFAQLDKVNYVKSKAMGMIGTRMPSESIFYSGINTIFAFGLPHTVTAGPLSLDVMRKSSLIQALDGNQDKEIRFAFVSGADSSILTYSVGEQLFSGAFGISALRALSIAREQGIPIYKIDGTNIQQVLPNLQLESEVKDYIQNAVNTGKKILVPQGNIAIEGWTGCGFILIDPATGDNAYMLSGSNGGENLWGGALQGLPWQAHSLAPVLEPAVTSFTQDYSLHVASDTLITGLGRMIAGLSDISSMRASQQVDLIVSGYLYDLIGSELGCLIDLSTAPSSFGACMALSLGMICMALDTETISTENSRPVAHAGSDRPAYTGDRVTLDGSGSYDADGDTLSYRWTLLLSPNGSTASLTDASTVHPSFLVDQVGTYKVQLIVSDGKVLSDPSIITITAIPPMIPVPDLTGLAQSAAETLLTQSGLLFGTITQEISATVPLGNVIRQTPASGTLVGKGSTVDLVISLGSTPYSEAPLVTISFDKNPPVYSAGEIVKASISIVSEESFTITMTLDGAPLPVTLPTTDIDTTGFLAGSSHPVIVTVTDASSRVTTAKAVFGIKNPDDPLKPEVSISSPVTDSEITKPTEIIGTVNDPSLLNYTLAYSPVGKNTFTVFAEGSSAITNAVLGKLDPTLLKNGIYDIVLTATDTNGATEKAEVVYRVSEDLKVGNFTVSFTDVNIPVSGIPVTVTRTYDSRDKTKGDFGIGWTIDIQNTKIEENRVPGIGWRQEKTGILWPIWCFKSDNEHSVTVTLPDGRAEVFDVAFDPQCQEISPILVFNIIFTPRPGTTSTLQSKKIYHNLTQSGANIFDYDTLAPYDPSEYHLFTQDGTIFELDQNFGVKFIQDANGNTVNYTKDGIIHSAGKGVTFTRDIQGRITKITDPNGGVIIYEYSATGDLASVTDQTGNITRFTYNRSHGLMDIKDPRGITPIRNIYDESGRLIAHIDAYGNKIEYTHDIAGRQEVVKDRLGNLTVYIYDEKGKVLQKTDPLGNPTTFTYDSVGNKLTEIDALGNITSWTYDAKRNVLSETKVLDGQNVTTSHTYNEQGKVLTTTDPMGNVTTNTYDTAGNLLTATDPLQNVTTNTYAGGNLLSITDALQKTTTYTYDYFGNRITQKDPQGNVTTYTYDKNGNKMTEKDPRGGVTKYTYDASNRVIAVQDPLGNINRTEYDKAGNKIAEIDPLGNRTTYVYNSAYKLIQTNYPDGTFTGTGYDVEGNRISSTDQSGRTTRFEYDANKNLKKIIYPDNTTLSYGYDDLGRQTTVTDTEGNVTTKEYDSLGRVTKNIDPEGNTTTFEYNLNGNQTKQIDANSHATTFEYDDAGRQTKTILQGGQETIIGYDALGRKTSETDAATNTTQFEYDARGNLIKVTDAMNGITQYEYDANGNRTAIVDANNHRTTFTYDLANRMTSKVMPNGGTETYVYDAAGRQISKTDAKGQKIQYGYDSTGKLKTKSYPDNSSVTFTYTPTGKRASASDNRGLTNYEYDNRDRLTKLTYPDTQEINYTYNTRGHLHTISSLAGAIEYLYNNSGRLQSVTDPQDNVTTYVYDDAGNRTGLIYPNGTTVSYSYDSNNRLTNITHRKSLSQILSSYAYTLGAIGNRTRIDESTGISRVYEYDNLYRLKKEQVTDPANSQTYTNDYSYDAVGNRLNKTKTPFGQPIVSADYTYNAADQLVTENGITYTYDLNGSLETKTDATGTTTYTYDFENRLVQVSSSAWSVSYVYDADGNRIELVTGSNTVRYLVDTNRSLAQVLSEYTPSGNLVASYAYADDLISMTRNGQIFYYHFDGLGSTRLLSDATGIVTDTYNYDAFGNLIARTGTTENEFLFTGQQYDANIGFYYLRARLYNPTIGRFNSLDPVEGDPYTPISLHKYLYAGNDPVNKTDPTGKGVTLTGTLSEASLVALLIGILAAIAIPKVKIRIEIPIRLNHYTTWQNWKKIVAAGYIMSPKGTNYFTPNWYFSADTAQRRNATELKPQVFINLWLFKFKDSLLGPTVIPRATYGELYLPGGGDQYYTWQSIPLWTRAPIFIPLLK